MEIFASKCRGWAAALSALACLVSAAPVFAQNIAAGSNGSASEALPQEGLLAVTGSMGRGDLSIPPAWGGESGAPLSGSVSIVNGKECRFSVNNQAAQPYKTSVEVVVFRSAGGKSSRGSYSYQLQPGKSNGGSVSIGSGETGCALLLRSWKKMEKAEKTPTPVPPA